MPGLLEDVVAALDSHLGPSETTERPQHPSAVEVVQRPHAAPLRCRALGLAKQKVPELLEIVDEVPRNAMGKIQKPELRNRFAPS